ncbi:MAG TPA: POTRA domain-containing protein [Bryobacteraceae bacterium]|nr:POTRA domain-containing protein [Bryobacteraceae bacterium]
MSFLTGFFLLAALFPIDSIQVEGLKRLKPEQVIRVSGLRVGQKADKPDFDAAQARLLATGSLASVGYRYASSAKGGYTVTFEVQEVDQVFPIRFEELPGTESELLQVLAAADPLFTNPIAGSEAVIKRLETALNAHLEVDPPVIGRILADRPDETMLLFRPNRPRPVVATVTFAGNKAFSAAELQNRMASVAIGVIFTEESFRELLQNQIRPLYETQGLLRVAFPKIEAKRAGDVEGLDVAVTVVEGEPYKLEKVTLTGAPDAADLLREAAFKEGEVFRLNEIVDGLERLRAELRAQGFMRVSTDSTRTYSDAKKMVNMNVAVTLGQRFHMGRLVIQGLDITTEPVIRKMWGLKQGAPFRDKYAEKLLQRVRDEGIMDNLGETKAKLDYDEAKGLIHVTLQFAGEKKEPEKKRQF